MTVPSTLQLTGYAPGSVPAAQSRGVPAVAPAMATMTTDAPSWSPHNPVFWVVALVGATVGLIGVAGSVRLGPAKVSGSLGKG